MVGRLLKGGKGDARCIGVVGGCSGPLASGDADAFFILWFGALVFFMQAGFALLEAGGVRARNTEHLLLKNFLDACAGALIWWGVGYAIAYNPGDSGFIGTSCSGKQGRGFFSAWFTGEDEDPYGRDFSLMWFECAAPSCALRFLHTLRA